MRTEIGIHGDLEYFASSEKKYAICVYGVRGKKVSAPWVIQCVLH